MFSFASNPSALEQRISTCLKQNALTEAQLLVERLPKNEAHTFFRGWLLFLQGKISSAATLLSSLAPHSEVHPFYLIQRELRGEQEERRFLALLRAGEVHTPHSPILAELRALSLLQLGFLADAETLLRQEIHRHPQHLPLQNALATVLGEQGAFSECLKLLRQLYNDYPERWEPINNFACMLNHLGHMDQAIDLYRRAIMMAPTVPQLRLNHSIALLKAGRFAQGWGEHEWRLQLPGHTSLPYETILPSVSKNTSLNNLRVLVTQEEGLGDTLMYLRYLPILSECGAKVVVWSSRELANLTQNIDGNHVVQVGGTRPPYDYHCPFISLPRVFNGEPHERLGRPVPYLNISLKKAKYWENRLNSSPSSHLRVGIVWAGGLHQDGRSSRLLDRHRSMRLTELSSLFELKNISFYNLQKGPAAAQMNGEQHPLIDFMPDCHDMEDTGALIQALDLVISVDTSIVHLAGGMGKPVFMMDRFCNCWRWGYKTSSSPWYPSLRIFRQETFDDWGPVVRSIKEALQQLTQEQSFKRQL